eukprot:scaffold2266_cov313-Prasinococcus_capsulatus_cf.AAC.4
MATWAARGGERCRFSSAPRACGTASPRRRPCARTSVTPKLPRPSSSPSRSAPPCRARVATASARAISGRDDPRLHDARAHRAAGVARTSAPAAPWAAPGAPLDEACSSPRQQDRDMSAPMGLRLFRRGRQAQGPPLAIESRALRARRMPRRIVVPHARNKLLGLACSNVWRARGRRHRKACQAHSASSAAGAQRGRRPPVCSGSLRRVRHLQAAAARLIDARKPRPAPAAAQDPRQCGGAAAPRAARGPQRVGGEPRSDR